MLRSVVRSTIVHCWILLVRLIIIHASKYFFIWTKSLIILKSLKMGNYILSNVCFSLASHISCISENQKVIQKHDFLVYFYIGLFGQTHLVCCFHKLWDVRMHSGSCVPPDWRVDSKLFGILSNNVHKEQVMIYMCSSCDSGCWNKIIGTSKSKERLV